MENAVVQHSFSWDRDYTVTLMDPLQKPTMASSSQRGVTSGKIVNRAIVHLSQGVRHHAEGCMAVGRNLASVLNNPLWVPGSTPLYSCFPLIWGAAGGDLLDPLYSWDRKWTPRKRKLVYNQRDSLPRRSL
jgi:hypothetical protein